MLYLAKGARCVSATSPEPATTSQRSRLANAPLTKWQAAALRLEARTTYILGPRQSGKSDGAALAALHVAYRRPDQLALVVSNSELGAKRLLSHAAQLAVASPVLSPSVIDEQTGVIRLSNGSQIRSVAASERSIRGWSVDLLVLDEATELPDSVIDSALPTTAARPEAKVLFLSTAGAPVGRSYETYMAGLDGRSSVVRSFTWALKDARWITKAAIEHERTVLPPWRFQAEYEGRWAGSADALFPADLLQRASADFDLPDLASLAGPVRVLGGVDWGASHDRTAVAVIARIPCQGLPVFVCWPARVFPVGHLLSACTDEIVRSAARWAVLSFETNAIGEGPSQDLYARMSALREVEEANWITRNGDLRDYGDGPAVRYNPTVTSWQSKAECFGQLRTLAERGQLIFQREPEFMRELASVRVEHRAQSVGIEAPAGRHDDLVDATAIAACSYRPAPGAQLRCHLGDLARNPRYPAADVPDRGGPTVDVDGLELPKAPWLQSVSGSEVTPPVGHDSDENPYVTKAKRVLAAAHERTR